MSENLYIAGPGKDPYRAHFDDAGFDLLSWLPGSVMTLDTGDFADVPCGISIATPTGWYGRITGRSSTYRSRGLLVLEGIIDEGYRGELFVGVTNVSEHVATIEHGERLGQLILTRTPPPISIVRVPDLPASSRGERGYGSTGI